MARAITALEAELANANEDEWAALVGALESLNYHAGRAPVVYIFPARLAA